MNITRTELNRTIQRLLAKEMIEIKPKIKDKTKQKNRDKEMQQQERYRDYIVTGEGEVILSEILFTLNDFEQIQYEGFSQEEIELYEKLNEKRNQNIKKTLR